MVDAERRGVCCWVPQTTDIVAIRTAQVNPTIWIWSGTRLRVTVEPTRLADLPFNITHPQRPTNRISKAPMNSARPRSSTCAGATTDGNRLGQRLTVPHELPCGARSFTLCSGTDRDARQKVAYGRLEQIRERAAGRLPYDYDEAQLRESSPHVSYALASRLEAA